MTQSATKPAVSPESRDPAQRDFMLQTSLKSTSVPVKWQQHLLIRGQTFYTLPLPLLKGLDCLRNSAKLDQELWELERELSQLNGDNTSRIGFVDGMPLSYAFLRDAPLSESLLQDIRARMPDADAAEREITTLQNRLQASRRDLRAYAGWLMANRQFLDEQQTLLQDLQAAGIGPALPLPVDPRVMAAMQSWGYQPEGSERQQVATQQLQAFCHRWRLQQLVAPGLPLPQSRQMLQGHLLSATLQAEGSGFGVVIIPDTMPIPRESELRSLMHDTIQATDTAHLTDWLRIITPANPAKKELVRYARIFELQHFYRCLMSRHAAACQRQKFLIMPVLAEYLGVSDDTIRKDLSLIQGQLGKAWWQRS